MKPCWEYVVKYVESRLCITNMNGLAYTFLFFVWIISDVPVFYCFGKHVFGAR